MTSLRARRPPAVTFALPLGEVILQIPEARRVVQAPGLDVGHVVIEYRTRGELIALAAYRDLPALMGREKPLAWSRGARGELIPVTSYAVPPPAEPEWWTELLAAVLARPSS